MNYPERTDLLICVLLYCFLCCLLRTKTGGAALCWLSVFFGWQLATEISATCAAYYYHTNYAVYAVAQPVDLLFGMQYFRFTGSLLRYPRFTFCLLAVAMLLQAANFLFVEPLRTLNTAFLQLKSLCIVICCLLYFYVYISDIQQVQPHFPVVCLFFFFYGSSFFIRTAIGLSGKEENLLHQLYNILFLTGIIFYAMCGSSVLFSKNKQPLSYG